MEQERPRGNAGTANTLMKLCCVTHPRWIFVFLISHHIIWQMIRKITSLKFGHCVSWIEIRQFNENIFNDHTSAWAVDQQQWHTEVILDPGGLPCAAETIQPLRLGWGGDTSWRPLCQRRGTLERLLSCCPIAQGGRTLPLARRPGPPVGQSGYHPYRTIVHSESLQQRTPSLSQEPGRSQRQTPVTPPLACWQHRTIGSWELIWGSSSSSLKRLQRHRWGRTSFFSA